MKLKRLEQARDIMAYRNEQGEPPICLVTRMLDHIDCEVEWAKKLIGDSKREDLTNYRYRIIRMSLNSIQHSLELIYMCIKEIEK